MEMFRSMLTMKFRAMRRPSYLEGMLRSLVTNRGWVLPDAETILDPGELPPALAKLATDAENTGGVWRAWLTRDGRRLFVAELSVELSRERGVPVLQVHYCNDDGALQEYSTWAHLANGLWQQCAV